MNEEIKTFQCGTVNEAEALYFQKMNEGCWQMVSCLKIKWSWKKFKYVTEFKMKKIETPVRKRTWEDVVKLASETIGNVASIYANIAQRKREEFLKQKP